MAALPLASLLGSEQEFRTSFPGAGLEHGEGLGRRGLFAEVAHGRKLGAHVEDDVGSD